MTEDTRALTQQMQAQATPPPPDADPIQLSRQGYRQIISLAGAVEDAVVKEYAADSVTPAVPLRLYKPYTEGDGLLPALVYFHGGGFVSGGFDTHDRQLRALANSGGCAVVAAGYRLAPEFPYPAAPEDCFAAFQWVIQQAEKLGLEGAKVAVGGDSAGGLLAAVVCLMCQDRKASQPVAQILVYPNTDLASDTPSWHEFDFLHPQGPREKFVAQMALYVTDPDEQKQPYASPLLAPDVSGLPPALIITAELDPQRDEGEAYAQRLREAGCLVTHTRYPGVLHGFFQLGGVIASGRAAIAEVAAYLRLRFGY
ncbi:MAG: alpha/beta hydrolase [Cyanobacteria bacterium Co-bin13]|nr:alpha/beta hydrolase [Cyanobacteria bacterium Co-bin13]